MDHGAADKTLRCSFCGKTQHEVSKLIAGPMVFICDECVTLCMSIIAEEAPVESGTDHLSPEEMAEAAQRQRDEAEAQKVAEAHRYANRSTPDLLVMLQQMRTTFDITKRWIRDVIRILSDRGVGALTIQKSLGIEPEDAIELFLGPAEAQERLRPPAISASAIARLAARGKERGHVTFAELNATLPQDHATSEEIEALLSVLDELGIEVVEAPPAA